jgi:hypothetical protein
MGAVKADTFRRSLNDVRHKRPSIPSGGPEAVNAIKGLRLIEQGQEDELRIFIWCGCNINLY